MMAYPETPPANLSGDPNHDDFHPCYMRVGIDFDGVERRDVARYECKLGRIWLISDKKGLPLIGVVEPFWRWPESRQERRARERWDASHGMRA